MPFTAKTTRQKFCSNRCRQKAFYLRYKSIVGIRYAQRIRKVKLKPRYKIGSRTKLVGGILKYKTKYVACICVGNDVRQKNFSIKKLGDTGSRLAASLQRMSWLIELGVWKPEDGDPFAILHLHEGNRDYENCKVEMVNPNTGKWGGYSHLR